MVLKDQTSIPPGPPHHVTIMQHKTKQKIHIHKMNLSQDENPIQKPVKLIKKLYYNYIMVHNTT